MGNKKQQLKRRKKVKTGRPPANEAIIKDFVDKFAKEEMERREKEKMKPRGDKEEKEKKEEGTTEKRKIVKTGRPPATHMSSSPLPGLSTAKQTVKGEHGKKEEKKSRAENEKIVKGFTQWWRP